MAKVKRTELTVKRIFDGKKSSTDILVEIIKNKCNVTNFDKDIDKTSKKIYTNQQG